MQFKQVQWCRRELKKAKQAQENCRTWIADLEQVIMYKSGCGCDAQNLRPKHFSGDHCTMWKCL